MRLSYLLYVFVLFLIPLSSCKKKGCTDPLAVNYDETAEKNDGSCVYTEPNTPGINENTNIEGYNILSQLSGIWNGPVYSPTPLGSFSEWIVDFRPISPSQVSAKNELDSINDIFMSFFICKYDNEYRMAFRNGGGFAGNVRNSYMILDSVSEVSAHSFYRFADPISGGNRVYTEVTLKDDSIRMHTYTNQFNTLSEPVTHMIWTAKRRDLTSAQPTINLFGFPQKQLTRDFTTTFDGLTDAVFYSAASDPYPEHEQPHLGNTDVNINISNPVSPDPNKKVLIVVSTQPLFSGSIFDPSNLDFRSRYVFIDANSIASFNFNYMHPGNYFVNAIYDNNGDFNFSSGDFINSNFDVPFTLTSEGNTSVNVNINFEIP